MLHGLRAATLLGAVVSAGASRVLALAAAAPPVACPVKSCRGAGMSAAPAPTGIDFEAAASGTFDVAFKPGHFICRSCDASACEGCALLCDLKQCTGKFYEQQCWCEDHTNTKRALRTEIHKVYCDHDCSGGICDDPRFRCQKREDACKPWWWCGSPPPKRGPSGHGQDLLELQVRLQHGGLDRLHQRRASAANGSRQERGLVFKQGHMSELKLNFGLGRFDCTSAALPPMVWSDKEMMLVDSNYIILDKRTCEGSLFDKTCFCWDNFKYLVGQDPLTSELKCDGRCHWGPCEGKTCNHKPPPALPAPTAVPDGPDMTRAREESIVMEPVDKPVLTG